MTYRRKNPEDYRWLAVKCRETAEMASRKIWDFLADHPEHHLQFDG